MTLRKPIVLSTECTQSVMTVSVSTGGVCDSISPANKQEGARGTTVVYLTLLDPAEERAGL